MEKLKHISLPIILAHAGGKGKGLENNREAILRVLPFRPQAIEIDVRKSRDGILFARHGSIPFGVLFWQLAPFLSFAYIQRFFPDINTLDEIAELVPKETIFVLDIKDIRITGRDLLPYRRPLLCVLGYRIEHMRNMKTVLGDGIIYALAPQFFLKRALKKAAGVIDIAITFFWQNNSRMLQAAGKENIFLQPLQFWISRQKYIDCVKNWSGMYIVYDYKHFAAEAIK